MATTIIVWITAPTTCPVSTETRAIAMVRKRAMMPSVMSIATAMAVPCATEAAPMSRIPGVTYVRYTLRPPPPRPAPSVPPNTYTNRSRNTTGMPTRNSVRPGYRSWCRRLRRSIVAESVSG
jgi:hypothetical protein